MKDLKTIKIWNKTHKELKVLAALQECSMIQAMDKLVKKALKDEQKP